MRKYRWAIWAAPVLALVLIAATPELSQARPGRGGGGGWSSGGRGYGGGRGYSGGRGYGGYYRGGYGRGWGWGPYIGFGVGYPYDGYYGGYSDYSSGYYDSPVYDYGSPVYASGPSVSPTTSMSFYSGPPANEADISVTLPANGTVSFGRTPMSQDAGLHEYLTPPLDDPNATYGYDVQAKWMENGQEVSRTRHVTFRAGQRVAVDFR